MLRCLHEPVTPENKLFGKQVALQWGELFQGDNRLMHENVERFMTDRSLGDGFNKLNSNARGILTNMRNKV